MRLSSFGGCFDKLLGVAYEDCYFTTTGVLPQPVIQWLNDTTLGVNVRRNLSVFQIGTSLNIMSRLDIGNGFLRDFRVSDFDANVTASATLSFVVVPDSLQTGVPGTLLAPPTSINLLSNLFGVSIAGTSLPGVGRVRGIHLSVAKDLGPIGLTPRLTFVPGTHQYDAVQIEIGTSIPSAASATYLQAWTAVVATGTIDNRDIEITYLSPTMVSQGVIRLNAASPRSALLPYSSFLRRSLTLNETSFKFIP